MFGEKKKESALEREAAIMADIATVTVKNIIIAADELGIDRTEAVEKFAFVFGIMAERSDFSEFEI